MCLGQQTPFTDEQIEGVKEAPLRAGDRHPAYAPLFQKEGATDHLTREAFDRIGFDARLLSAMRGTLDRAVGPTNLPDAAAALAELRACSAMLEAGMEPVPLKARSSRGATPDFTANAGDGAVTVEVHAKHEDGAQTRLRQDVADGKDVPGVERSRREVDGGAIESTTMVLHPGGAPAKGKPGDSVQANVISKLCAVKQGEAQRRPGIPSVLWLDLNNFGRLTRSLISHASPLLSGPDGLTSGAIWYAFYGWKGAPILEGHWRRVTMQHAGRFRSAGAAASHFAAVVVCFDRGLVLLENAHAKLPLPPMFRRRCERLPWFDLARSIANWTPGEVLESTSRADRRIESFDQDPDEGLY